AFRPVASSYAPFHGGGGGETVGCSVRSPDKANGRIRGAATRLSPATSSRRKPRPSDLGSCQRRSPLWSRNPGLRSPPFGASPASAAFRVRFACPGCTCRIPTVGPGGGCQDFCVQGPQPCTCRSRPCTQSAQPCIWSVAPCAQG